MESSLCTFIGIFTKEINCDGEKIRPQKIVIPIIQRDYAQGRNSLEINRVRKRFLDALYKAVTSNPVTLDFIYGDIDDEGILTPLDGQQRLTTLFLLHWYAAKKDKISPDETDFLKKFSYEIRPDARDFCKNLTDFQPAFDDESLSAEIENQNWFPFNWLKDPTVNAMLRMLDAIHEKFFNVDDLWAELEGGAIYFHFLSIKNIGLTDELYITMNSRGKPLTDFEHFKAEFKRKLDEFDEDISNRIILNIDTKWTDLLWNFRGSDNLIDDMFLNYFRFICDILRYKRGGTSQGKSYDEFILLEEFFGEGNIYDNVEFLEKSFDCWCDIGDTDKFFDDRVSLGDKNKRGVNRHQRGKIILYNVAEKNIFKDCLKTYSAAGERKFTLPKIILLYAFLKYMIERKNISDVESKNIFDEKFRRRIRIVNNLVNNTDTDISDSEKRQSGNRLPAVLQQVDSIIRNGKILTKDIELNFNTYPINEECEKLLWTNQNPDKAELLFELEDHYLLYGQIGILGIKNLQYFKNFISLFNCDYSLINYALLTFGDYFQNSKTRYQLGSENPQSWQNLFHRNKNNDGFENTQYFLSEFLAGKKFFTNEILGEIISEYLSDCESKKSFEWSYYYIKYPEIFNPNRYGKYDWENFNSKPYEFIARWTNEKWSENAYQPFLKILEREFDYCRYVADKDADKNCLVVDEKFYIKCENSAYVKYDLETGEELARLDINQRNGIDKEDRIKAFSNWKNGVRKNL